MDGPSLRYRTTGPVARLTIDNPARRNAMTLDMWSALPDLVRRAEADPEVRVILLRGAGDAAFCAGADISQFSEKRSGEAEGRVYDAAVEAAQAALFAAGKPTVAYVRGACFGGGVGIALSCDLRVAAADARFRIPAARLGLGYTFSNVELVTARLGASATADLLFTARTVDAEEARRLGIVGRLFGAAEADAAVEDLVAAIGGNAPLTLRAVKRALVELARPAAERDTAAVDALVRACLGSDDYREGQAAFKEKREPRFHGV
ncbi:enoyl-CoA hydratase [Azospirillum formosense]|uniref:enoyl-CoA hydratase n=1 Tax=Azospirillum formosense TaxID=861533 RepID=UPI001C91282C|nr:enoyl-CoA hydratase [Azospirillum formosense]MBY3756375.1 enoyl-CoA hydratase [Azospirillum formosense]